MERLVRKDDKNMCLGQWFIPGTSVKKSKSGDPMEEAWEDGQKAG